MNNKSFYEIEISSSLLKEEINLKLYSFELDQENKIYAFVKVINTSEELNSNWFDLTQVIGTDFLCELTNEFSRWNTYLIFISEETVEQGIRSSIENNKIFVRKIVSDNFNSNGNVIEKLNTMLLGFDIDMSTKKDNNDNLSLSNLSEVIISNSYSRLNKEERLDFILSIVNENKNEN